MYAAVDGVGSVAFALMLWYATSSFGVGVSAGLLVAFIEYVNRLFTPLKEFSGKIAILQRASTALGQDLLAAG
jgi:ATP-binding cassette subfamily B multidrug efflux pump